MVKNHSATAPKKMIPQTYVLIDEAAPGSIAGYFTLAIRTMTPKEKMPEEMVRKLPNSVPGFTLARLAVAATYQGQGFGKIMLSSAMRKVRKAAAEVAGFALFVDAKDQQAAEFYKKYGFEPMPSDPLILAMPVANIPA
jgi:ribosomal protein S18 acetylase RimI-like enzyme